MRTFSQIHKVFLTSLAQLKELECADPLHSVLHSVKVREIGYLCFYAEEYFPATELALLKDLLAVTRSTGERCKHAYCRDSQKWIERNDRRN